jgi:hypothetical protein
MKGSKTIEDQLKGPFLKRKRGVELIKTHNKQWVVKFPKDGTKFGTAEFIEDETKVTLDLTKVETVDLIACDADGNQFTFRMIGYKLE